MLICLCFLQHVVFAWIFRVIHTRGRPIHACVHVRQHGRSYGGKINWIVYSWCGVMSSALPVHAVLTIYKHRPSAQCPPLMLPFYSPHMHQWLPNITVGSQDVCSEIKYLSEHFTSVVECHVREWPVI